jgi:hypothetical protein
MEGKMRELQAEGFDKKMKLESSISTTNMVLFNKDEKIQKYGNVLDIIQVCSNVLSVLARVGYLHLPQIVSLFCDRISMIFALSCIAKERSAL